MDVDVGVKEERQRVWKTGRGNDGSEGRHEWLRVNELTPVVTWPLLARNLFYCFEFNVFSIFFFTLHLTALKVC